LTNSLYPDYVGKYTVGEMGTLSFRIFTQNL
jgi:hypothetical protein